jgi:hypothetical protein
MRRRYARLVVTCTAIRRGRPRRTSTPRTGLDSSKRWRKHSLTPSGSSSWGPSTAKLQFERYLHEHDRALEVKIVGLETVDHPTDAQLVAYVKEYFDVPDPRLR